AHTPPARKTAPARTPPAPRRAPARPAPEEVKDPEATLTTEEPESVVPATEPPAQASEVVQPRRPAAGPSTSDYRPLVVTSGSRAMVEAIGVTRVYGGGAAEVRALDDVDLTLYEGEMAAVMGPSGSGKTTLLNCLSGLDQVTSGEVLVEGKSLAKMSDARRTDYRSKRMGFVFQAFNLLPVFSAVENVELPLLLAGRRASQSRRRAMEALDLVGLTARARHRPAELSSGEQQRVAIARAIAPEPAVLWADEPTGNLDSDNAANVIQILKRLNTDQNLTILMVTHDASIARWAERILRMKDGRMAGPGLS
ncbi:MAG: ABC transporter ATP-binding protein, partial [Actinomycetota bacterium]